VDGLASIRASLGDPVKRRLSREDDALYRMAKKLVAARDLPAGVILAETDIAVKSPGDGLRPYRLPDLVGRRLLRPLSADDDLLLTDVR
jgi:N-acetylneuraminate synthase/sialic acid synthase